MTQRRKVKTSAEVKAEFKRTGMTVSGWASRHGFKPNLVFEVLHGRSIGNYGQSHRIAVLLGLKNGEIG